MSSMLSRSLKSSQIVRGAKYRRPTAPTPPSWYQKHALMYGVYEEGRQATSLPAAHLCNVHTNKLYSMVLGKPVKFKASAAALEMIDRMGGLDIYIMHTPLEKLGGLNSAAGVFKGILEERLKQMGGVNAAEPSAVYSLLKPDADGKKKHSWRHMLD